MKSKMKQKRISKGWALEYVAKHVGITKQSMHLIETGKNSPSYSVLCKLENLFNLSHRELFAAADETNPSPK